MQAVLLSVELLVLAAVLTFDVRQLVAIWRGR
jgi:hypothetical protein